MESATAATFRLRVGDATMTPEGAWTHSLRDQADETIQYGRVFELTSPPNALADASECAAAPPVQPIARQPFPDNSKAAIRVRFIMRSGATPVLRLRCARSSSCAVELP